MWIPYDISGSLKAATAPETIRQSRADETPRVASGLFSGSPEADERARAFDEHADYDGRVPPPPEWASQSQTMGGSLTTLAEPATPRALVPMNPEHAATTATTLAGLGGGAEPSPPLPPPRLATQIHRMCCTRQCRRGVGEAAGRQAE